MLCHRTTSRSPLKHSLRNTTPRRGGGVQVRAVDSGTRAEASGLQSGDTIIEVAGTSIATLGDLDDALDGKRAGATYSVTVTRGGNTLTLQLTLDS
ncbi:PDZ domain-containing protein [Streptosporangium sp. G11]|uniref:PDZ domain-containing protein n=1 Tax=Streptosporangium sp. G11 TaxID=3436926 RepID=UPI003EBEFFCA